MRAAASAAVMRAGRACVPTTACGWSESRRRCVDPGTATAAAALAVTAAASAHAACENSETGWRDGTEQRHSTSRRGWWHGLCERITTTATVACEGASTKKWMDPQTRKVSDLHKRHDPSVSADTDEEGVELSNWSGTHTVTTARFVQPETLAEVQSAVRAAHASGRRLRVVGSAISPNGIGFCEEGMLSLSKCDSVVWVDREKRTVRVQAGARVSQVVDALEQHDLTLQNYASIREQQIGGFIQVGAHGTGAAIPPVDQQVIALQIVTPGLGTLELTRESDGELFTMSRLALGAFGVVTEVTLQCVPRHQLIEETHVVTRAEARSGHAARLRDNQHVRYLWIPYVDAVVVVACNPLSRHGNVLPEVRPWNGEALEPLRRLLRELDPSVTEDTLAHLSFADLRDRTLAFGPLDVQHVERVNAAEAEFWRATEGITKIGYSDQVLGFDCGGSQWVNEVAMYAGTLEDPNMKDIACVEELLGMIESRRLPAPSPIEQRWSSRSMSPMSVASEKRTGASSSSSSSSSALFSWIGIIMYLCVDDETGRAAITEAFAKYRGLVAAELDDKYGLQQHWAKIEVPTDPAAISMLRKRLATRFPVELFNDFRRILDPKGIMSNRFIDALFGQMK